MALSEERKAYLREWRRNNRERVSAYQSARREERNANWRSRQAAWKEKRAAAKSEWHERNRDRILARKKALRSANPGWNTVALRKRRAAKLGAVTGKIDFARVLENANGLCGICKKALGGAVVHFDHIVPLARGGSHTEGNLQAAHAKCNLKKGARVVK